MLQHGAGFSFVLVNSVPLFVLAKSFPVLRPCPFIPAFRFPAYLAAAERAKRHQQKAA